MVRAIATAAIQAIKIRVLGIWERQAIVRRLDAFRQDAFLKGKSPGRIWLSVVSREVRVIQSYARRKFRRLGIVFICDESRVLHRGINQGLASMPQIGRVSEGWAYDSLKAAHVSYNTVKLHERNDPDFAAQLKEAEEERRATPARRLLQGSTRGQPITGLLAR